ncbi:phage tail protein [Vibrio cholerae]|uniref:phage tail protein n=1 Tax=Vibrio cholerae TaxID=666 RepID=UPI001DC03746|nr:phage tail protein [Vibrio cholerae]EGR1278526.1 phage tail protein [Vibrio cholerae]EHC9835195.1 phage tail protein [Vibrio cholerae]ELI0357878.1 phage tail protein [Vibrio cholerae]ELJ8555359.1 phage tail protein [Vibrio cholerae]ELJ8722558.1 phage tail protein [Vibrio cholerae]
MQKYYANNKAISQSPLKDGIEISAEQYEAAALAKINGQVVDVIDGELVIKAPYVKVTAYLKSDCTKQKEFDDITLVTDDYTLKEPATRFDEWIDDAWVTNISNQYIDEFDQVDNLRRGLYFTMVDPLVSEANIKRLQGKEAEAIELERQAIAAREKIQLDHPWPVNPEA